MSKKIRDPANPNLAAGAAEVVAAAQHQEALLKTGTLAERMPGYAYDD